MSYNQPYGYGGYGPPGGGASGGRGASPPRYGGGGDRGQQYGSGGYGGGGGGGRDGGGYDQGRGQAYGSSGGGGAYNQDSGGGWGNGRDGGYGGRGGNGDYGSGFGGGRGGGGPGGGRAGGGAGRNQATPPRNQPTQPPVFVLLPELKPKRPAEQEQDAQGARPAEPAARTDYGTAGKAVKLVTNCVPLAISDNYNTWYKYEVVVAVSARERADGSKPPPRGPPPKSVLRALWTSLEQSERENGAKTDGKLYFGGVVPAFDGRAACYTNKMIPTGNNGADPVHIAAFPAPDRPNMTFSVTIKNPIPIPLASLRSYITGGLGARYKTGELAEALQALNVVLGHKPASLFYATRTSFFVSEEASRVLEQQGIRGVQKESLEVAWGFLELWRGFFQAVRPCPSSLVVNLNTTSTAFYEAGDLSNFIQGYFTAKGVRAPQLDGLDGRDLIMVNRLLPKLTVTVERGTAPKLGIKLRGRGIVNVAPRNHVFDSANGRTNVEDYLFDHFHIRLRNPRWPLVEVKPGTFYPLELIRVCEGNKYLKRLSPAEQTLASTFQTLPPGAKLGAIMAARSRIVNPVSGPFLTSFGLSMDTSPKETHGRILAPPVIEYKMPRSGMGNNPPSFTPVKPQDGAWMMKFARGGFEQNFVHGGSLSSLVVVVPSERDKQAACAFMDSMKDKMIALGAYTIVPSSFHATERTRRTDAHSPCAGMDLKNFPRQFPPHAVMVRRREDNVQRTLQQALDRGREIYRMRVEMVVWFFEEANSPDYQPFKKEATALGVASQALQKALTKKLTTQVFVNVGLKLNAKLSGYSHRLDVDSMGRWYKEHAPMIFGADLSHEPDRPSVAVVVASMHKHGILYEETAEIQGLVEPADPAGRPKKQETIRNLKKMIVFLLRRHIMSLRKPPSNAILVFRDGVSESEFSAVIAIELPAYHEAFKEIKADKEMARRFLGSDDALEDWEPKVTMIATLKRHHIRAFVPNAQNPADYSSATNILPGTVFDRDVTDPKVMDHYGCGHKALIGTARATRYVVLVDEQEPRMTANEVQETCNALTHAYQRCNRAVSLPAPVFYADLIANRIRGWLPHEDDAASATGTYRSASSSTRQQDLVGARAILEETERGRDAFRGDFASRKPPAMWWC